MTNILQNIAENKRKEISALYPDDLSLQYLKDDSIPLAATHSMSASLRNTPGGIIAEFKRRSPSKGEIFPMADISSIIPQYVNGGAAAISVLTDTRFFGGAPSDLANARTLSGTTPLLRKDFIVSEAQIYEARRLGASAILLIATILSEKELAEFNALTHTLGMEALVEIHDFNEIDKITFKPDMLGVNNRNLSSFHTDISHSLRLIQSLPQDCLLVAESGIKTVYDIKRLKDAGFTGFLIGETFMSSDTPYKTLKTLIDEIA